MSEPRLHAATALHGGLLAWGWEAPITALSSAAVGGGLVRPDWLVNICVPSDFSRTDLDAYVAEIAADEGLVGDGVALLTAVNVARVRSAAREGVAVHATVGVSRPTWAAHAAGGFTPWAPGTINLVVHVPVALAPGAAVNAVVTATEAKSQALHERGVPGTGTASDAIVVVWPSNHDDVVPFAGPRSEWGARIAQATHAAVLAGLDSST